MSQRKLAKLMSAINGALASEDRALAAGLIVHNLDRLPDPALLRERVALVLAQAGRKKEAVQVFEAIGRHYANAGHPERAIAAAKQMQNLNPDTTVLLDHIATLYNIRSPFLRQEEPTVVGGFEEPDEVVLEPDEGWDDEEALLDEALERALDSDELTDAPDSLPVMPLLSLLPQDNFRRVLDFVEYEVFDEAQLLVESGARFEGLIWTASDDLVLQDDEAKLFLRPCSLLGLSGFGQSARPSEVDVFGLPGSEILRLKPDAIVTVSREVPDFQNRLATLRRHAMTERLLRRHPMFQGLENDERVELIEAFTGMRVSEGEKIIAQNTPSPGLYIILDGEVDIVRKDEDWEITIATLEAGDVFGEIGLVAHKPAVAGCVMTRDGHLLHLPRSDFEGLATEYPAVAQYTAALAEERLNEVTLTANDLAEVE